MITLKSIVHIVLLFSCSSKSYLLLADSITVTNESSRPWSLAVYYVNDAAEKASKIYKIDVGKTKTIERPEQQSIGFLSFYDRELVLSSNERNLKQTLSIDQFNDLFHGNVGSKWGNFFYITDAIGGFKLITPAGKILGYIAALLESEDDSIFVSNETFQSYYCASYYIGDAAHKATDIALINAGEAKRITRPGRKFYTTIPPVYFDRELVVSAHKSDLKEELSLDQLDLRIRGNIGSLWGSNFYIVDTVKKTEVVSVYEKKIVKTLDELVAQKVPHPHSGKSAVVRYGNELPPEEAVYRKKRLAKVNKALSTLLGDQIPLEKTPTIAVVCSGGGMRAALFTTGWLSGASQEGLLDALTYAIGLSGSTWAIGTWISTGKSMPNFRDYMIHQADVLTVTRSPYDIGRIVWALLAKKTYGQPVSPVDFYGGLVADILLEPFGNDRQFVGLSEQRIAMASADKPFPIYTAAGADTQTLRKWYEFTPYEVGASWLGRQGMYIASWALGRQFSNGNSIDYAIELPFAHAMGYFGSAFSVSIAEVLEHVPEELSFGGQELQEYSEKFTDQLLSLQEKSEFVAHIGNKRLAVGEINNFTRGIRDSPIKNLVNMRFVDAGVVFNLPYPPISGQRPERKADIVIFVDASASVVNGSEFRKVEQYAREHNLPYPEISENTYTTLGQRAATVIQGTGDQPTIIYMPFVRDSSLNRFLDDNYYGAYHILKDFDPRLCVEQDFCKTTNFRYKKEKNQARKVVLQGEFNIKMYIDLIKQTINEVIKSKY